MKRFFLILMVLITASNFAFAGNLSDRVNQMVNTYWQANEALFKGEPKLYLQKNDEVKKIADSIANDITNALKNNDDSLFNEYVTIYNQLKSPELLEVLNLVADQIKEYKGIVYRDLTPDTNFPGYGYAEPGYVYRRGEELKREVLSVYWKRLQKVYEKNTSFRVQLELNAALQLAASGAVVQKIGKPINININGNIKTVVECQVTVKNATTVNETVKYQRTKVWFRLYRAEKSFWNSIGLGSYEWQAVGKTYQIFDEESGLPVVELPNQTNQSPKPTYPDKE